MKRLLAIVLLLAGPLWAADKAADAPLLPPSFSDWQKTAPTTSKDANVADAANGALLKEYGFTDFESATYTRPGRTLKIKAARFTDRSGAYGAFTFYKTPPMITEAIGDQASSSNEHVLFYRGNVLVEAVFDRVTAMSAAELRELAGALPLPEDKKQEAPTLPTYLPKQSYVKNSAKYVVGPIGLAAAGVPIPPGLIDFSKSPEIAMGKYTTASGEAKLTLIYYPTPQIAAERLRAIEGALDSRPDAHTDLDNFAAKRSGPIVAVVTGAIPAGEAKTLLGGITYDADVTWNEAVHLTPKDNIGNLIVAAFKLIGILLAGMLLLGGLFAAARLALRRFWPQLTRDDGAMIRLDIGPPTGGPRPRPPSLPGPRL